MTKVAKAELRQALDELKAEIAELKSRVERIESRPLPITRFEPLYRQNSPYQPNVWCGLHEEPLG